MLNRISSLGKESIIHRINPVIKLLGLFLYILVCLLKFNNILFICNISFVFLIILLSNVNILMYLKVLWKMKYILIIVYVLMYRMQFDFMTINIFMFKLIFLVLYLLVIIFTTTREDIGKSCSILVNRFNVVGVSVKSISMFFTDIFVFIDYFKESYQEIFRSNELKGIGYSHSNILKKWKLILCNFKMILDETKKKMDRRKRDLEYRLYNNKVKKKYKYRNKLFVFDYIYVILNIGMILFYILKVR